MFTLSHSAFPEISEMAPRGYQDLEKHAAVRLNYPELIEAEKDVVALVAATESTIATSATRIVNVLANAYPDAKTRYGGGHGIRQVGRYREFLGSVSLADAGDLVTETITVDARYPYKRPLWYQYRNRPPIDTTVTLSHRPHYGYDEEAGRTYRTKDNPFSMNEFGHPLTEVSTSGTANSGLIGAVSYNFLARRLCDLEEFDVSPTIGAFKAANADVFRRRIASSMLANLVVGSLGAVDEELDNVGLSRTMRAWHGLDGTPPRVTEDAAIDVAAYLTADAKTHMLHPADESTFSECATEARRRF